MFLSLQQGQTLTLCPLKVKAVATNGKWHDHTINRMAEKPHNTRKNHSSMLLEVFLSGGSWGFLVDKPMLWSFRAVHNHMVDKVSIPCSVTHKVLINQIHYKHAINMLAYVGLKHTSDIKQGEIFGGVSIVPVYQTAKEHNVELHSTKSLLNEAMPTPPELQDPVREPITPWMDI